jgi:hypothetical protein
MLRVYQLIIFMLRRILNRIEYLVVLVLQVLESHEKTRAEVTASNEIKLDSDLHTIPQACAYYSRDESCLRRWVAEGILAQTTVGASIYFTTRQLMAACVTHDKKIPEPKTVKPRKRQQKRKP